MDHLQKNTAEKERAQQSVLTVDSNIIRPDIPRVQVTYDDKGLPVFLDPNASLNQQLNTRFGPHWAKESAGIVANFALTAAATFVPDGAAILPMFTGQGARLAIAGAAVATKAGLKAGGAYAQQIGEGEEFSLKGYGKQFKKALIVPSNWAPISGTALDKAGLLSIDLHGYKKVLGAYQPRYGETNLTNLFGTKFQSGFATKTYFPTEIKGSTTPLALGYTFEKKIANYAVFGTGHHGGGHGEGGELTSADIVEASPYRKYLTQDQLKEVYETERYYKWNESLYHPKDIKDVVELALRRPLSGFKRVLLDETIIPYTEHVIEESNAHVKEIVKNSSPAEIFQVNTYGMGPANMVQAELQTEALKQAGAWIAKTTATAVSSTLMQAQLFSWRLQTVVGLAVDKIGYYIDKANAEEKAIHDKQVAADAVRRANLKKGWERAAALQKQRDAAEAKNRRENARRLAQTAMVINTKLVTWKLANGKTVEVRIDIPVAESTGNVNMSRGALEMKAATQFKNNTSNKKVSNPIGSTGERSNPFRPR